MTYVSLKEKAFGKDDKIISNLYYWSEQNTKNLLLIVIKMKFVY